MTRDEAVRILQSMKSDFPLPKAAQTRRAQNDALDVAIEPMKAEPCEDAVSRQAAIDALDKRFDSIPTEQTTEILLLRKDLRNLTPAQPEVTEEAVKEYCRKRCLCIVDSTLLKKYVSAQLEAAKETNVTTNDCISRQAAIDAAIEAADEWDGGYDNMRADMITDAIRALPPAQPELHGWICPVCGRGLSPFTMVCPCNNGKGWEITC